MKTLPVGEFKAQFSDVLEKVKAGESFGILYGKRKNPVAMIVPFSQKQGGKRKIGLYDGKTQITFSEDFSMTEEDLVNLK